MGRTVALVIGSCEYGAASLARLLTPSEDVIDLGTLLKSPDTWPFFRAQRSLPCIRGSYYEP